MLRCGSRREATWSLRPPVPDMAQPHSMSPERGHLLPLLFKDRQLRQSELPRCRTLRWPLIDKWIIEYLTDQKLIVPDNAIVVGQSAGGWAAIALSSQNVPAVRAIVAFAAGRGGRVGGKPNNNCAPDKLVAATGEFGRTARTPMLWIYIENDTFFGPELSKRMHAGLYRGRRKCRISPASAVRQRRTFPGQFARRPSVVDAAGRGVPGQTQID